MPAPAIEIKGLTKSYGDVHALNGVDISIKKGEFFGLLGPNGAGKTTTINILTGLYSVIRGSPKYLAGIRLRIFVLPGPRSVSLHRNFRLTGSFQLKNSFFFRRGIMVSQKKSQNQRLMIF